MAVPTQVTLIYDVSAEGIQTAASVAAALAAVALPCGPPGGAPGDFIVYGVSSVISDNTVPMAGFARRTIVMSIQPPVSIFAAINPQTTPFRGSVVSSNPKDTAGGSGLRGLDLSYTDANGLLKTEHVDMNGTTPQQLLSADKVHIVLAKQDVGGDGSNDGLITLLNDQGTLVLVQLGSWQGSIVSTSPDDTAGGIGAQMVQIAYDDLGAVGHVDNVALNGQTPVNFTTTNKATVVLPGLTITAAGTFGYNTGIITVYSGLNGTGAPVANIGQSFFSNFPPTYLKTVGADGLPLLPPGPQIVAADQTCAFVGVYQEILSASLGCPVTAHTPTLS
jgi:hypothetical protein